jgi:hypothetical protein
MKPEVQVFLYVFVAALVVIFGGTFLVWVLRVISGDGRRRQIWTDEQREWFRQHGKFKG